MPTKKEVQAKFSGPSARDIIASDKKPAEDFLLKEENDFQGDKDIDFTRYTSQEFFDQEMSLMWPKVWQWACREEHLQEVGDTYIYEFGNYSIIIVKSKNDLLQAFLNTCSHRGTKICPNEGSGSLKFFRCPFHGWSWNLDGTIKNIPGNWDFPHVSDKTHGLQKVKCDVWGGFVFINLDLEAGPLQEYLEVLPDHFEKTPLENRHITLHIEKTLPANWKASQEAFLEAYHSFETHRSPNGANCQYDVFGKRTSRFLHNRGTYSPMALDDYPGDEWRKPPLTEEEILKNFGIVDLETTSVPDGETAREVAAKEIRLNLGDRLGVDLSNYSDSLILDSIQYHLFPNMFFFPGITIPMCYRFRPLKNDPEKTIFDIMFLSPLPKGAKHPDPPQPYKIDIHESYQDIPELGLLGRVFDEDTNNLILQQEGFKTNRKKGLTLGNYQESRIRRIHATLDEFLKAKI